MTTEKHTVFKLLFKIAEFSSAANFASIIQIKSYGMQTTGYVLNLIMFDCVKL